MEKNLWSLVAELNSNKYQWVDLSHPLTNDSPVWEGIPKDAIDLGTPCFDWDNGMLECQIQTFKFPGQFGTHIDFPGHFKQGAPLAQNFGPQHMLMPLVVIDISHKVATNPDYTVTLDDIKEHEDKYGQIPTGAFVALHTGWAKRWEQGYAALNNLDEKGISHAPGWSLEVLKFLYETRAIQGNGHETLDTDASVDVRANGDLCCERYVLSNGHFQVEVMNNLHLLPPTGAAIFLAWNNIVNANGLPVRAIAIY